MLDSHSQQVVSVNRALEDVFGPLPAIAATPFLGLAVLTGAAVLTDHPFVAGSNWPIIQRLRRNALILETKTYASWWLFGALVLLALITGLANAGKLEGAVGKFARGGENVIAGLAYLVVAVNALKLDSAGAVTIAAAPSAVVAGIVPAFESSTLIPRVRQACTGA